MDAGTYKPTTGAGLAFSGVESLVGAATAADSFDFESGAGLSGTVDDGGGTLTVSVIGFVKISGDFTFAQATHMVTPSNGSPISANVLTISGPGGSGATGFLGVEALGNPVGLQGSLGPFALAIFTADGRAWQAFNGTITAPTIVGLEDLDILIASVTVILNDTAADDSWLNLSANPLTPAGSPKTFNSPSTLLSVSVPAQVTISDFIYASGMFTFALGGEMKVDVATGLPGDGGALHSALEGLTVLASDDGTLGRSADYSIIYNLPVRSFQIAATNVNLFIGDEFSWVDANGDGLIQKVELGSNTAGFYAGGVDIGLLLLSGQSTGQSAFDAAIHPKFFALTGSAAELGLVHITDFSLEARGITFEVNSGKVWSALPGAPVPVVDWQLSFPDTAIDTDTDPDGFQLLTPGDPIVFALEGTPLVGFAAEHVVLQVADNVFVSGAFSFRMGEVETVDVVKSGPDIAGLQVKTIKVGAQGVSIFLGDGLASYDIDDDIATYMSDQHPAMVVTGETVGNLVDGKIYRLVGSTLSAPNLTPGGGTGQNYSDTTVWRPVAATYLAGDSPGSVAVGETVGVWDATTVTYRVFERTTSVFTLAGALSADLNDYTGAGWVEQLVFHNGDGTLNAD